MTLKLEHTDNTKKHIFSAYPAHLYSDVDSVLMLIRPSEHEPFEDDVDLVVVNDEYLDIPRRIYFAELKEPEFSSLSETQQAIALAIYTRHCDGFVREKCVRQLLDYSQPWLPPFVLRLIGEYVIEIIELLASKYESLDTIYYTNFIEDNQSFNTILSQKVVSYWNCYFRSSNPIFREYVGYQLLRDLRIWQPNIAPRLIRT